MTGSIRDLLLKHPYGGPDFGGCECGQIIGGAQDVWADHLAPIIADATTPRTITAAEELDALPELTAREHLEAAWDAAYPLPEGRKLPAGTPYVCKREPVEGRTCIVFWPNGDPFENAYSDDVRTLDPLPPVVPDDCMEVRASSDEDPLRSVWIRDARAVDAWVSVTVLGEVMRAHTNDLIDPKPVPEEES